MSTLTAAEIYGYAIGAGFSGSAPAGGGDSPAVVAVAIALAESGGNTTAQAVTSREDSRGLWQINTRAHPSYDRNRLFEPAYNASAAFTVAGGGRNFQPWSAYTGSDGRGSDGPFRSHLGTARAAAGGSSSGGGGGGIGLDDVGRFAVSPLLSLTGGNPLDEAGAALGALADFARALTSGAFWLRVLTLLAGAVAIAAGVALLTRDLGAL